MYVVEEFVLGTRQKDLQGLDTIGLDLSGAIHVRYSCLGMESCVHVAVINLDQNQEIDC